jgi:hypothetical protein
MLPEGSEDAENCKGIVKPQPVIVSVSRDIAGIIKLETSFAPYPLFKLRLTQIGKA